MTVYTTTYVLDGTRYCGKVCAISWDEAQQKCDARRPGEVVDGELIAEYDADDPRLDKPYEESNSND